MALLRIQTRGPKIGRCNICGTSGSLTEDHTPPKGCYPPTAVELHSLVTRLSKNADAAGKPRRSQNGVKFRTLCSDCNNGLLGAKYDPPMIQFVGALRQALQSTLHLPAVLNIQCQPQAVMRSVLGHMCAQGVDRYLKGPLTEPIRDYMLDSALPLPAGLQFRVWPHPYRSHVMIRDAGMVNFDTHENAVFWLLKFFPVAFMVIWSDEPHFRDAPITRLDAWREASFDHVCQIPMRLRPLPGDYWPEAPTDMAGLLFHDATAIHVKHGGFN